MPQQRAGVAMSGGVDSSVAAALLQKDKYDVIGVTHQTWPGERQSFGGCCGLDAIDSARSVANTLKIPYYVLDLRDEFAKQVINRFCNEYKIGRTPNPCVLCNQYIRFGIMLEKVLGMGIDYLATGHYARIHKDDLGYHLLKGSDPAKDQSYFLYTLGQNTLKHIMFPVGDYTKVEIRKIAAAMALPSAGRKDSQNICFITGDYRSFICEIVPLIPGDIVDTNGEVIGKHEGLPLYTIGQRHGLGVTSNEPVYVVELDAANNRVIAGGRNDLLNDALFADNVNWISGSFPGETDGMTAKIRYKAVEARCCISLNNGRLMVKFEKPQMSVTPGQSIVFYQGEEVLGGGIIEGSAGR